MKVLLREGFAASFGVNKGRRSISDIKLLIKVLILNACVHHAPLSCLTMRWQSNVGHRAVPCACLLAALFGECSEC